MRKGQEFELNIESTEFPGEGVAIHEGHKINVKGAIPGQKVLVRISKNRPSRIEGKIINLLEDVDYKINPPCPITKFCGGCAFQDVPYDKQLQFKTQQVLKLFNDAGINDFDFLGIEHSPNTFEYRNKMEYTFGDMEKDGELNLGMHAKNRGFCIVSTDECKIVDEDFREILKTVISYCRERNFSYYKVMKREGYLRNLVIRKGENTGEILINIVTTTKGDLDFSELVEILKSKNYKGTLTGIIHTLNDSLSDAVQADEIRTLYGREYIYEDLLGLKFKINPLAFFQTNSKGAEKLYSIVRDFIGTTENKVVFDLYCGTGTIGQIVAPKAKKVIGIELIEEAVKAAQENAKLNNLNNCEFIAGDVLKVITEIKQKPDAIILDPPRSGVHPTALKYVINFKAKEIVYVSCNPKSLVVDLAVLIEAGYKVEKMILMDMFAHTPHVETVVRLKRKENIE